MLARTHFVFQKDGERRGEAKWRTSDYTAEQKKGAQKAPVPIPNTTSLVTHKAASLSLQCT